MAINIFVPPAPAVKAPINHLISSDNWYHLEGTFFFLGALSENVDLHKYKFLCQWILYQVSFFFLEIE